MFLALFPYVHGTLLLGWVRGHPLRRGGLLVLLAHRPLLELLLLELLLLEDPLTFLRLPLLKLLLLELLLLSLLAGLTGHVLLGPSPGLLPTAKFFSLPLLKLLLLELALLELLLLGLLAGRVLLGSPFGPMAPADLFGWQALRLRRVALSLLKRRPLSALLFAPPTARVLLLREGRAWRKLPRERVAGCLRSWHRSPGATRNVWAEHHYFAGSLSDSRPVYRLRGTGLDDAQARHTPCNDSFDTLYREAAIHHAILDNCIMRDVPGDPEQ